MHRIACLVPLVLLAACGQEPAKQPPERAAAAAVPDGPQPGLYRTTMKVNDIRFPGLTGPMAQQARTMFGGTGQITEFCLTPTEATKGRKEFLKRTAEGDCKFERFNATDSATGAAIDAAMVCQTGQGMIARTELAGTFTPTKSELAIKTESRMPHMPGGSMTMDAQLVSERIGDCP